MRIHSWIFAFFCARVRHVLPSCGHILYAWRGDGRAGAGGAVVCAQRFDECAVPVPVRAGVRAAVSRAQVRACGAAVRRARGVDGGRSQRDGVCRLRGADGAAVLWVYAVFAACARGVFGVFVRAGAVRRMRRAAGFGRARALADTAVRAFVRAGRAAVFKRFVESRAARRVRADAAGRRACARARDDRQRQPLARRADRAVRAGCAEQVYPRGYAGHAHADRAHGGRDGALSVLSLARDRSRARARVQGGRRGGAERAGGRAGASAALPDAGRGIRK